MIINEDPGLPIRQATRILNEFQLGATTFALTAVGPNLDRVAVFMAVLRAKLGSPDAPITSANAIAASLQRPLETIRRHMQSLVRRGLCRMDGRRFVPANGMRDRPEVSAYADELLKLFRSLLDEAASLGLEVPPAATIRTDGTTLIAALDIMLGIYELSEAPATNTMNLYVLGAVAVLNAAKITHDPVLSRRYAYADTVPPDALRQPATVRAIAGIAGLSYSTIWRHTTALADGGALVATPDGYLLARQWMDDPGTSKRSLDRILHFSRVLRRLAAAG